MSALRAGAILTGFALMTLPLMPVQALLVRFSPRLARKLPHWYHRHVCRLVGIRLSVDGAIVRDTPVLLVANHTSWLDIPVLSAVAPLSFVAKTEVGTWPFVSALARLQRTVFVDRKRRTSVAVTANAMLDRLRRGDALVLFAEGTSSDGNRVLPFKTSLFGAAKPTGAAADALPSDAVVQTLSIVYTHLHGIPLGRADRPLIGWYGDMDLGPHAWALLKAGPLDVAIRVGPAIEIQSFPDRKALATVSEAAVRQDVIALVRSGAAGARREAASPRPAASTEIAESVPPELQS